MYIWFTSCLDCKAIQKACFKRDIVLTLSHISTIKVAKYELHAALHTGLDVASVVSGGLVLLHSPTDTLPALAHALQGPESVTVILEARATCLLNFFPPWLPWPFPTAVEKMLSLIWSCQSNSMCWGQEKSLEKVVEILHDIFIKITLVRDILFYIIKRAS